MFSCCRCVNPKSPKYKKKGEQDNDSTDQLSKDPHHDDNLSSEEEIKVEIIETDGKPVESETEAKECDHLVQTTTRNDSSSATKCSVEEAKQNQPAPVSPKASPNKSSTSSEHQQQSAADMPTSTTATEPAYPESTNGSSERIPTTVAEVEEAREISASKSNSSELNNEENNAISEHIENTVNNPPESEPKQEEKRDRNGNGKLAFFYV